MATLKPYIPGGDECADRMPGHQHCVHGHTADCPNSSECLTWKDGKPVGHTEIPRFDGTPLDLYHVTLAAAQVFPHASPDRRTLDIDLDLSEDVVDQASAGRVAEEISIQVRNYLGDQAYCPEFTGGEEHQLAVELIGYLDATNGLRRAMAQRR